MFQLFGFVSSFRYIFWYFSITKASSMTFSTLWGIQLWQGNTKSFKYLFIYLFIGLKLVWRVWKYSNLPIKYKVNSSKTSKFPEKTETMSVLIGSPGPGGNSLTPSYLCVGAGASLTGLSGRICGHSLWNHTGKASLLRNKSFMSSTSSSSSSSSPKCQVSHLHHHHVRHRVSPFMWLDFIHLEEVDALLYETEHEQSVWISHGNTWRAWSTSSHLCVCGHASADATAWSTSCCNPDKHIRMDAFRWPLMT